MDTLEMMPVSDLRYLLVFMTMTITILKYCSNDSGAYNDDNGTGHSYNYPFGVENVSKFIRLVNVSIMVWMRCAVCRGIWHHLGGN